MFNKNLFTDRIAALQRSMKSSLRGEIDGHIEVQVIDELCGIYLTMAEKYEKNVLAGSDFPAQPGVVGHPESDRVFQAMLDLLERMEMDFIQKFTMDIRHDLQKEVEIGKIKIALLDGVRRNLNLARSA